MIQIKKFSIEGMDCGGCAASIKTLLNNQPGVKSANVSFEKKEVIIELDSTEFKIAEVEKIIKQMGYTLTGY